MKHSLFTSAPVQPEKLNPLPNKWHIHRHEDSGNVVRFSEEFGLTEGGLKKKIAVYEGLRTAQELFRELSDEYGIETAGFHPAIAHTRERNVGAIIVSEWIDGKKRGEFSNPSEEEVPAAKVLLRKLTHYLIDKRHKNEPFLSDIGKVFQYKIDPDSAEFKLVDMDPFFEDSYASAQDMLNSMDLWANTIMSEEEHRAWYDSTAEAIKPVLEPSHA